MSSTLPATPAAPCVSCGAEFRDRFCPACGERRLGAEDRSVRRYVGESIETLTDVDSTLLRTAITLVRRPGLLTAEYLQGRRKPYLRPVQLFIICNVLYFFLQPLAGFNPLTLRLAAYLRQMDYSHLLRPMVEAEVARRGTELREYQILFDATVASQARSLVFLLIPIFALVVHLAYPRARRYFAEHLVFATHLIGVFLLSILLLSGFLHLLPAILVAAGFSIAWMRDGEEIAIFLLLSMLAAYLYPALRRVYGGGRAAAALRAAGLAVVLLYLVQLYRFILFFTTFYTI
jgi:hypothetical protein